MFGMRFNSESHRSGYWELSPSTDAERWPLSQAEREIVCQVLPPGCDEPRCISCSSLYALSDDAEECFDHRSWTEAPTYPDTPETYALLQAQIEGERRTGVTKRRNFHKKTLQQIAAVYERVRAEWLDQKLQEAEKKVIEQKFGPWDPVARRWTRIGE